IPWVELFVEVWPLLANRIPECCVDRLEEARAPRGDGKPTARTDKAPQLAHRLLHVRHEEDAEHADHGVERRSRQVQLEHVAKAKLNVLESPLFGLALGKLEQILRKVDAENEPVRADGLRRRERRSSATAADIKTF